MSIGRFHSSSEVWQMFTVGLLVPSVIAASTNTHTTTQISNDSFNVDLEAFGHNYNRRSCNFCETQKIARFDCLLTEIKHDDVDAYRRPVSFED